MGNFTFQLEGLDNLLEKVEALKDPKVAQSVRSAMRQGGELLKARGLARLSMSNGVKTGALRSSIKIEIKRIRGGGMKLKVGFNKDGHHAHLVDRGTKDRYTKKGAYRGRATGSYFWTNTRNANQPEVAEKILNEYKNEIVKVLSE